MNLSDKARLIQSKTPMLLINGDSDPALNLEIVQGQFYLFKNYAYKDKPENLTMIVEKGLEHDQTQQTW